MTNPWDGERHRSWASNTVLMTIVLVVLIVATVVTDMVGDPPAYLTGLLGTAAGVWFSAIASDKGKRDAETAIKAARAETKAAAAPEVAEVEHPENAREAERPRGMDPPAPGRGSSS